VKEIIKKKGQVHLKEFAAEFKVSHRNIYPFLDYLDSIGFTKRIEDKRVLAEHGNLLLYKTDKRKVKVRFESDSKNRLINQKPEMAKKECI